MDQSKEEYFITRLANCFGIKQKANYDKFKKSFELEDNKQNMEILLNKDDIEAVFCLLTGADSCTLKIECPDPDKYKKKGIVCLKLTNEILTSESIASSLVFFEMTRNVHQHCYLLFQEVLGPVFQNANNQAGWTDLITKDLMEKYNNFIAQTFVMIGLINGQTMLPMPSAKLVASESTPDKDKAHIFESSIITWTKQIKNILKLEPEQALKQGNDPGPLTELEFWEKKANNLNSIFEQLESHEVQNILRFLEGNKSTYTNPFSKLQKEVMNARIEANDNFKYLNTLRPWFERLCDTGKEFNTTHELYIPIMHLILLIWKKSKYYNTPPRLVVLIREICNAIITKAREYMPGPAIFQLISSEETFEACEKLATTIDVCTKFKDGYFEYKAKAENTWKLTTNALFVRLDSFLERCHDILHLTNTIVQFNKLAKIELGGTKGKALTETLQQIFIEFKKTVDQFQTLNYDIMDIENKQFDDDFYEFRSKIKELERRLASVITQGFDDCDTIHGRFKLLDSFEGLLNRPIIQDELEKKHIVLLDFYKQDLKQVQAIFLDGKNCIENADYLHAPIYNNMPPISGTLTWCKGLHERMKEPLQKIQELGPSITEREEYKDVQKLYNSITKAINEYEQSKILQWEKEVEASSQEKLKQPLLTRDEAGILRVNFDPALTRLLREVRYFKLLDLSVPVSAAEIYNKDEFYRTQIVSLDLLAGSYNEIITCLHPVEEPLIKDRIEKMDAALTPALDRLKWESKDIAEFIKQAKEHVDSTFEVVQIMKEAISKIKTCLDNINVKVLERKNRTMTVEDYNTQQQGVFAQKMQNVKDNGNQIHKLVREVHAKINIDKKSPIWKAYVDYVNEIVLEGISQAVITALKHLNEQIDPIHIKKHDIIPIFEIKLELQGSSVNFDPPVGPVINNNQVSVYNAVSGWINDFFQFSIFIQRLDTTEKSDFLTELRDYFDIKEIMSQITFNLDYIQKETFDYLNRFQEYKYLWLEDPSQSFEKFLIDNDPVEDQYLKNDQEDDEEDAQKPKKENPLLKGAKTKIPPLHLFDKKIKELKSVQNEINRINTPIEIAWLKISLQPLKISLNAKVVTWITVFTQFLSKQFKTTLYNLTSFISNTQAGIERNPAEPQNSHDKALLMSVMKVISDVKDVEPKTEAIIKRIKEMVNVLKLHGYLVPDKNQEEPLQAIDNTQALFNETTQRVFKIKADILPLQTQEAANIKKELVKFGKEVKRFRQEFLSTLPFEYSGKQSFEAINLAYGLIDEYHLKLSKIKNEAHEFNNLEKLFELEQSEYKELRDCYSDLKNLKIMWDAIGMINFQYKDWKQQYWRRMKADNLIEQNKVLSLQLKNLPRDIKNFKGYNPMIDQVKNMGVVLPLVSSLHSEFMEKRHWKQLQEITEKKFDQTSPSFAFEDVLELQLHLFENQVNELVDVAQKEAKIEKKLKNIEQAWTKIQFEFEEYNGTKVFIPLEAMMEQLDQHSMDLMGMKSQGKYVEFFINTVEEWRGKLGNVDSVVNEWMKVQKNWKMLVNIFLASEDIKAQLSEETKLFEALDREFRDMMIDVSSNPLVVESCTTEKNEILKNQSATIKRCEKSLNEYLEQKKKSFPRFYFLSNQSLLTILSNGTNPPKVCEFIGDCFDGLKSIIFDPCPPSEIPKSSNALISKDGEIVPFTQDHFVCDGAVENWLSRLENKMRLTLYEVLEQSKATSEFWDVVDGKHREEWCADYPAQCALLTTQMVWTEDVTRAFEELQGGSETAMKEAYRLIEIRIEKLIIKVRGDLSILERKKIINIITIDVHSRDVVEKFVIQKVQEPESFNWLSQLKFYWEGKETDMASRQKLRYTWEQDKNKPKCIIKIVDWFRFYSFEYTGNADRLVVTPLTDRCYITLTQALNLTMGGAPAGPAGTGKTETTKDLGRGVGLPVMVFNCSDQMNKDSMAQIFMGLSQTGAWGCFDEFNRITVEVLSVVSSQVKCVLDALKERKQVFQFMEEGELAIEDTVGFFITMNPGYAGRTELPENLKAQFRSCAMVVPDLVLICENMLMSEGFQLSKPLSRKFVTLYMLSRDLLSKQRHYDWALRAVKSVLRQAGKLKRSNPNLSEDELLMKALRDFNMPKIVTDDKNIFIKLIEDLFPGIKYLQKQDLDLKKIIMTTAKKDLGLVPEEVFTLKVVQLREILEVRHCVFVVGPPGCGKSTVWQTLIQVQNNLGEQTDFDTLNPKAVTSDELYGCYSKTKEWKNGVLSMIMKNQAKCEEKYKDDQKYKWSVLDGDIDPEWIESLNTVMDDNKVLTLVSNDRIFLTPSMRLCFEISNLKNATPATVSRAGVLFINDSDIGWIPYMNSWLERSQYKLNKGTLSAQDERMIMPDIDDVGKNVFYRNFQQYVELNTDLGKLKHISPVNDMMMVQTLCTILDALLLEHVNALNSLEEEPKKIAYETLFIFACMWAFGGSIGGGQDDEKDQKEFNSFWRSVTKIKFPEAGYAFDYFCDPIKSSWQQWQQQVVPYGVKEDVTFTKIYVGTLHTTRLRYLLDCHVVRCKPVLFIGNSGTGKTAVIKDYLASTKPEKIAYRTISFNSFTTSFSLQKSIETMVEKKSGKTYGSATNKILIYFIDDMNMPFVDHYGTQSPISLLNYIVDYGSIFNREQLEERKFLQDLLFLGALNPKAGSFIIDSRLQRHFSTFTMFTPDALTIKYIYGQILAGHFGGFQDSAFDKVTEQIIEGTIFIFNKILRDVRFSPSARKFFYQFNLRDLSKISEGIMQSQAANYRGAGGKIYRLWAHECKRVIEDRLINQEDIAQFRIYLKDSLAKSFGEDYAEYAQDFEGVHTSFVAVQKGFEKTYICIENIAELKKVLEEKLAEYNETKSQMNLVLFNDAITHVCKISRILDFPVGNALLIGVGGSGKQSLSKLAAFIIGCDIEQLVVTSNFGINDLRTYLQDLYKKIAKPGANPVAFMITDSQIKNEGFLVPINDILNNGWVQDLFPKEDVDGMISGLRNEAKGAGIPDTADAMSAYFLETVKSKFKMILCFSPVGDNFRVKSRKFPGLVASTSIDYFHPWPLDALIDVANRFIQEIEMPNKETLIEPISQNMASVHGSIDEANARFLKQNRRYNYTTPKSFLELISFYKQILEEKQGTIFRQIARYEQGLQILAETQSKVEGLQEELKVKMVEVGKRKAETNILIAKVGEESASAEVEQIAANEEEEKTNVAAKEAGDLKEQAEKSLAMAVPALKKAEAAIDCIKKGHITEMKSMGSPPQMVIVTAKCIMILLGEKVSPNDPEDKIWKKAVQMMNNPDKFLTTIKTYNGETIDQSILDQVYKLFEDPQYNEENMKSKNYAAACLCLWSISIVTFNRIFKEVKPIVEKKDKATEELEQKKKDLAIVKEKVRILNEKVDGLKRLLAEAVAQKEAVEADAQACENKLSAAIKLVNGLSGENKRWLNTVKILKQQTLTIIGDALLASAFVSYIGAFTSKFRLELWQNTWLPDIIARQIPITEGITPLKILTTESKKAQWCNEGLPADSMSIENASIISSCSRWPLIIDPQLQGSIWIRGGLPENLIVINPNQNKWLNNLINAIQMGKLVLIEGIQQELDATLDPLLSRAIKKKGKNYILEMGGDPIDYDINFKLFLVTKLFNPHFRPEIAAQCTLINFIVTESGLEEQLLASVVNNEKAELEYTKQELVKQLNDFQVTMDRLEEELLQTLSEADPATILENKELIDKLDITKKTSQSIEEQSEVARRTEIEINTQREIYRGVATEGAMLYFLIITLNIVAHMYQYSLDSFYMFFRKAITKVTVQDDTRIEEIIKSIRYSICQWVMRGLFERHKLIFLSLLTFRLMQKKNIEVTYDPLQMDFLLKGVTKPGVENPLEWLPTIAWESVQGLIQLEEFKNFAQNMEKDAPNRFKDWYNELTPEDVKLPLDWKRLDNQPFQKLLVIRCLRPDRITVALSNFIRQVLPSGDAYMDMDSKNTFTDVLEKAIEDSDPNTPIFFILSPGSDPVKEVEKICKKQKIEPGKGFFSMALGQGMDEIAKRRIEEGNKEGHWVMLENIHLMPTWLLELEKLLDAYQAEAGAGNPNFKLFLSADPSPNIPIGILDRSIKLTNEPPQGLKANMKRAWNYFPREDIDDKDPKIKSILFALCFFHSTMIERRRFGPKGWNMMYPFSIGDLRDSYLVLNKYMESNQGAKVPFEDLIYIFGEIMYGGHIVDDWDRRLCNAYLQQTMNEGLFDELELFPFIEGKNLSFKVPIACPYDRYQEHIEQSLGPETPLAYGLHPNTEIGFRTTQCNQLFSSLLELTPKDSADEAGGEIKTPIEIAADQIKYILEDLNLKQLFFNLEDIKTRIDIDNKTPYQNVFMQEMEYMNALVIEIITSLEEIAQGIQGLLTISESMEKIIEALSLNRVPILWQNLAYPSKRGLASWLINLIRRIDQLNQFKDEPTTIPKVVMISRFFNPQSFLTAIKQVVGRAKEQELNKLYIQTEVTKKSIDDIEQVGKEGAYVIGFILEGARWDLQLGQLEEARPKEMFSVLPVVYCRALPIPQEGKEDKSLYQCPCYKTEDRGNTYVFTAQLKTRYAPRKWILSGTSLLLDVEGVGENVGAAAKKDAK